MNKEVVASYPIKCIGSSSSSCRLDPELTPVDVSLTIYKDGTRDVGCPFISGVSCEKKRSKSY
jgi:hypothetical protein